MLFVSAKVSHLALLPQGRVEVKKRVTKMVAKMDALGFGNCTNTGACEAECPKGIKLTNISRMNRHYEIEQQLNQLRKEKLSRPFTFLLFTFYFLLFTFYLFMVFSTSSMVLGIGVPKTLYPSSVIRTSSSILTPPKSRYSSTLL